jgi:peptidoglycan/xylan/chitin deacetylase (PgdA/CDA1 family)
MLNTEFGGMNEVLADVFALTNDRRYLALAQRFSHRALLDRLERRQIAVFGADLWASDWDPMTPAQQLALVLGRLDSTRGGIILFHDTKAQTAAMLPALLRDLKRQGYRIVHVVAR